MATIASILRDGEDPSMPALRAWLANLSISVAAAAQGVTTVATVAARDTFYATEANRGKLVYVNNNNGSATDPANGVYEYVGSAPRLAAGFYSGVTQVVQPLVDEAEARAASAAASAALAEEKSARFDEIIPEGYDAELTGWLIPFLDGSTPYPKIPGGLHASEQWRWLLPSLFTTAVAASIEADVLKPKLISLDGYDRSGWTLAITAGDQVFAGEREDGSFFFAGEPRHAVFADLSGGYQQVFSQDSKTGQVLQLSPPGSNNTEARIERGNVVYRSDRAESDAPGKLYATPLTGGAERAYFSRRKIATWGDSQSTNTGGSHNIGQLVAELLGWAWYNGGVASQTSYDIAARQGGNPALFTVTGNSIPTSGAVAVTARTANPVSFQSPSQSMLGTLAGVPGTVARDGSNNYTFTRTAAGDAVACPPGTPFTPATDDLRDCLSIFGLGRNDGGASPASILNLTRMVDHLAAVHPRWVVWSQFAAADWSVANAAGINANFAARYPNNFLDLWPYFAAAGNGSSADNAAIAAGLVPPSLLADGVPHLNNAGKAVHATALRDFIVSKGWHL